MTDHQTGTGTGNRLGLHDWSSMPGDEALLVGDTVMVKGQKFEITGLDARTGTVMQTIDPFADMVELIEEVLDG